MMSPAMLPRPQSVDAVKGWADLQEESDRFGVQEVIREAIRSGTIRVVPGEGGRVRILSGPAPSRDGHAPAGPKRATPGSVVRPAAAGPRRLSAAPAGGARRYFG